MSNPQLRVLVLDRTNDLAARLRRNVVGDGGVVQACPDAGRAEARLGLQRQHVSVVLNKVEGGSGDDDDDHVGIPYSRDVSRSINVGVPIIVGKPKSKISTSLTTALSVLLTETPRKRPAPRQPIVPDADVPAPDETSGEVEEIVEIDLRAADAALEVVLIHDGPVEARRAEPLPVAAPAAPVRGTPPVPRACRGRGPPCPDSPRPSPALVPSLVTK